MGCRVTAHRRFWQDERALTRYLDVGYQLPVIYSSHGSEREVADNVDSRITQAPRWWRVAEFQHKFIFGSNEHDSHSTLRFGYRLPVVWLSHGWNRRWRGRLKSWSWQVMMGGVQCWPVVISRNDVGEPLHAHVDYVFVWSVIRCNMRYICNYVVFLYNVVS